MKSCLWYFIMPGMAIANDLRFEYPVTKKYAQDYLKEIWHLKRLPRGTQFWV